MFRQKVWKKNRKPRNIHEASSIIKAMPAKLVIYDVMAIDSFTDWQHSPILNPPIREL